MAWAVSSGSRGAESRGRPAPGHRLVQIRENESYLTLSLHFLPDGAPRSRDQHLHAGGDGTHPRSERPGLLHGVNQGP